MVSKRNAATAAEIPTAAIEALRTARDAATKEAEVDTALANMFEALGCSVAQRHSTRHARGGPIFTWESTGSRLKRNRRAISPRVKQDRNCMPM